MSYNWQTQFNSNNFTAARDALAVFGYSREIEGYTLHWWGEPSGNPSYEGVVAYLCRTDGNTSAHIVTSGTGRRAACIVGFNDVAWHSGSAWGNARTIGIELDPRAREEDKDVFAEVLADLRSALGDKPLYWHSYFTATTCPGVYKDMLDDLDARSYQKLSGSDFGKVTNKSQPVPVVPSTPTTPVQNTPAPVEPSTSQTPAKDLYKVLDQTVTQVGAYSEEGNAYKKYVDGGRVGRVMFKNKDITAELDTKYTTPSPTATPPEQGGGLPVAEKPDYSQENNVLLKAIKSIVDAILAILTKVFK